MVKAKTATSTERKSSEAETPMPLFYNRPEVLSANTHGDLRILPGGCGFASNCIAVPVVAAEFAAASSHYPLVFADGEGHPLAILGLERENLFVEVDGQWSASTYTPAYVRRYPFVFVESEDGFVLCIDRASERVTSGGEEGVAIYEDGEPSAVARDALAFCRDFLIAHQTTRALVDALRAKDVLTPQQADIRLSNGRPLALNGWQVVDRERLAKLDDETVLAWHRNGYLEIIHQHLASLQRFPDLLLRQSAREGQAEAQTPAFKET